MKAVVLTLGLALGAAGCAPAQVSPQEGIPEPGTHRYDPGPVETVNGRILGADRRSPSETLGSGVRVTLGGTGGEPVDVALAPGWYLDQRGLHFAPNERVWVRGTRVEQNGRSAIIAQEITAGGRVYRLRDSRGRPLWRATPVPEHTP